MLMVFDPSVLIHEDELPDTMTAEEYDLWYEQSLVDGVRVGPRVLWVEEQR